MSMDHRPKAYQTQAGNQYNDVNGKEVDMRAKEAKGGVLQLPFEVLVGSILSVLSKSDLISMSRTCKSIHRLYHSDYLWQRKFYNEFYYRPNKTLKQLGANVGWRRIYHAMDHVEVYTWGTNIDCRLGYGRTSRKLYESVPKRVRRLDDIGIIQLEPTGWGFHALDKHGNVWAWGRVRETNSIRTDSMPRMLKRPRNVVELSAGKQVVLAKDVNGQVWQWCRENKVVQVTFGHDQYTTTNDDTNNNNNNSNKGNSNSNINDNNNNTDKTNSNTLFDPVDRIAAGSDICAALTRSGRIFAWKPPQSTDSNSQHRVHVRHSVSLSQQGFESYESAALNDDKFVQIAAGSDYVIAVTLLEKVFIFRTLDSPNNIDSAEDPTHQSETQQQTQTQIQQSQNSQESQQQQQQQQQPSDNRDETVSVIETLADGSQQERVIDIRGSILLGVGLYLPIFSEALTRTVTATYEEYDEWERRQRLQGHHPKYSYYPTSPPNMYSSSIDEACCLRLSSASRPTTVSANCENFSIHHSSGKVLWGKGDVQSSTLPTVIERLHSNVTQIGFGDDHQGLLTEDGQLRTWGSFSNGALGQGDLRCGCGIPTVVEGSLKNKIVIGIGMAGWQSACLAIDLSDDREYSYYYDDQLRGYVFGKMSDRLIDDGYYSHENTSFGSGSGSSSEGCDSSDGEEWTTMDNEHSDSNHTEGSSSSTFTTTSTGTSMEASTSHSHSAPIAIPTSCSTSRPFSYLSHNSSSCSASCTLHPTHINHNYNNNRCGSSSVNPRLGYSRKRSSSLVEMYPESSYGYRSHHDGNGDVKWYMLAMTRLSPILTTYEPLEIALDSLANRRFSVI
ncbi:hypothetical protein BGZ76_011250 [Entomortierella beljakovae]|nr:hypothetical protein BGZ76_011250 [Entomortierella beljakovae]